MGRAVSPGFLDLGGGGSPRAAPAYWEPWLVTAPAATHVPTSESLPTPRDGRGSTERGLQGRGGGLAPDSGWHAGLEYLVKSKGNHDSSRTQGPQRRAEDTDPSKGKGRAREQS